MLIDLMGGPLRGKWSKMEKYFPQKNQIQIRNYAKSVSFLALMTSIPRFVPKNIQIELENIPTACLSSHASQNKSFQFLEYYNQSTPDEALLLPINCTKQFQKEAQTSYTPSNDQSHFDDLSQNKLNEGCSDHPVNDDSVSKNVVPFDGRTNRESFCVIDADLVQEYLNDISSNFGLWLILFLFQSPKINLMFRNHCSYSLSNDMR
jgi:hypothetical protein